MRIAIARAVSPSIARCELTHLERQPIDWDLAVRQHAEYLAALAELGCRVIELPAEPELPDAVFVEDAALVLDELAVLTRPGALSRRPELPSIERALAPFRPLARLEAPATLDGGDVLRAGRRLFVGRSGRTNREAIEQLAALVRPHGYSVTEVAVSGCLHLKSAVTEVGEGMLLLNPAWIEARSFAGFRMIAVDEREPHAANALRVGERVVFPTAHPHTAARLSTLGLDLRRVDLSELAKAEGAVTCCSLLFDERPTGGRAPRLGSPP